jgi:hypothetical protein
MVHGETIQSRTCTLTRCGPGWSAAGQVDPAAAHRSGRRRTTGRRTQRPAGGRTRTAKLPSSQPLRGLTRSPRRDRAATLRTTGTPTTHTPPPTACACPAVSRLASGVTPVIRALPAAIRTKPCPQPAVDDGVPARRLASMVSSRCGSSAASSHAPGDPPRRFPQLSGPMKPLLEGASRVLKGRTALRDTNNSFDS